MVRIAFYSHDTFGLGHLRRCLKLTHALGSSLGAVEGLLITGSPWAQLFPRPRGFEYARLPPIVKRGSFYQPQDESAHLPEVLDLRQRMLGSILRKFRPDLLIVDNVPCGLKGEMLVALRDVKAVSEAKCVLALRDILDRPDRVAKEWSTVGAAEALQSLYDEVWVFGDHNDLGAMNDLPGFSAAQVRVCGRLGVEDDHESDPSGPATRERRVGTSEAPRILVSGGGGGDADALVTTYVEMLRRSRPSVSSHIVLGPDFPPARLTEITGRNGFCARIDPFVSDMPRAMKSADLVVAMAGYNTTCELEAAGQRAVLVPRVWPREEQLLRARKQEQAGRATVLHPRDLSPENLWESIQTCLERPAPGRIHHTGAENAVRYMANLLQPIQPSRVSGVTAT